MIDIFVNDKNNTLHTQFPLRMDELAVQLASIGVRQSVAQIVVLKNENLKIELEGLSDVGTEIVSRIAVGDTLADVDSVCLAVGRACPYGYSEFLDMLHPKENGVFHFYEKFDHVGPSHKEGMTGLMEEVVRYNAVMSEYTRVCNEEVEEEAQDMEEELER